MQIIAYQVIISVLAMLSINYTCQVLYSIVLLKPFLGFAALIDAERLLIVLTSLPPKKVILTHKI